MSTAGRSVLDIAPVIPVVVIDEVEAAVPLAQALLDGGVGVIEVTLRSDAALDGMRAIADAVPGMQVGAGTVFRTEQIKLALDAGAQFLVSPGSTDRLLDGLQDSGVPFLAGTATPSDMMRLLERDITEAKLFPATVVGGIELLKAVYGPLPGLRFCPTGGVRPDTAAEFLALPNVGCVGGTWIAPTGTRDWAGVRERAAASVALRPRR